MYDKWRKIIKTEETKNKNKRKKIKFICRSLFGVCLFQYLSVIFSDNFVGIKAQKKKNERKTEQAQTSSTNCGERRKILNKIKNKTVISEAFMQTNYWEIACVRGMCDKLSIIFLNWFSLNYTQWCNKYGYKDVRK